VEDLLRAEYLPIAEKRAITVWQNSPANNDLYFILSPNNSGRKVQGYLDGVLTEAGEIRAVVEMKCRDADWCTFENTWDKEVMIRRNKLENGKRGSRLFGVPFVLLYYLAQEDILLEMAVTDNAGNVVQPVRLERTQTRANIDGGEAFEMNAFIDMNGAILYKGDDYDNGCDYRAN